MRHWIVTIAISLLLSTGGIPSKATAQQSIQGFLKNTIGFCNGILAEAVSLVASINQGTDLEGNCTELALVSVKFGAANVPTPAFGINKCTQLPEGLLWFDQLSTQALERVCCPYEICGLNDVLVPDRCLELRDQAGYPELCFE